MRSNLYKKQMLRIEKVSSIQETFGYYELQIRYACGITK